MTIWALPGQIALIELRALGTAAPGTGARRHADQRALSAHGRHAAAVAAPPGLSHLALLSGRPFRRHDRLGGGGPALPGAARGAAAAVFLGFAIALWLACLVGTAAGYFASSSLTELVTLGLVFLNPIYFILILGGEVRHRLGVLSLLCGATCRAPDALRHAAMGIAGGRHPRRHGGVRRRPDVEDETVSPGWNCGCWWRCADWPPLPGAGRASSCPAASIPIRPCSPGSAASPMPRWPR
jgi:hypothetical protein